MESDSNPPETEEGEAGPAFSGDYVTISRVEWEMLQSRAESPQSENPRVIEESAEAEAMRKDSVARSREARFTTELAARDQRLLELERSYKAVVRERELATALAGRSLVAGAASQLIKLWNEDLDVYEEGGVFKVASRNGRTVNQIVAERLASPEYSHFCLPTSRGGTGAQDANRPSSGGAPAATPKNLGESIVMRWKDEAASRPNSLLKPIGLRRSR